MVESNWDASRKAFRKRVNLLLSIGIPLFIVIGIIFYNNRDVVFSQPVNQTVSEEIKPVKRVVTEEKKLERSVVVKQDQINASKKEADSVSSKQLADSIRSEKNIAFETKIYDSVRVSGIECRPDDRPDVVLNLSLMLYFTAKDMRSEIMLRREEIRVIARKVLHSRDFKTIKKEIIEPELRSAIKDIFDNRNLDDVKIVGLQIEKVQTP